MSPNALLHRSAALYRPVRKARSWHGRVAPTGTSVRCSSLWAATPTVGGTRHACYRRRLLLASPGTSLQTRLKRILAILEKFDICGLDSLSGMHLNPLRNSLFKPRRCPRRSLGEFSEPDSFCYCTSYGFANQNAAIVVKRLHRRAYSDALAGHALTNTIRRYPGSYRCPRVSRSSSDIGSGSSRPETCC